MSITRAALAALMAVILSGCAKEGPPVAVSNPEAPIQYNQVVILDKSLQNWSSALPWERQSRIAVERNEARRSQTGTMEVLIVLRNRTDYPMQIEVRTQFFDRDKVTAEDPSAWQRVFLPPQSVATYKEFSSKVDVHYYMIELREGR